MVYFYFFEKLLRALGAGIRKDRAVCVRAVGLPGRFFYGGDKMTTTRWDFQNAIESAILPLGQFSNIVKEIGVMAQGDEGDIDSPALLDALAGIYELIETETRQRLFALVEQTEENIGKIKVVQEPDEQNPTRLKIVSAALSSDGKAA